MGAYGPFKMMDRARRSHSRFLKMLGISQAGRNDEGDSCVLRGEQKNERGRRHLAKAACLSLL
jgi:hypothetical protein